MFKILSEGFFSDLSIHTDVFFEYKIIINIFSQCHVPKLQKGDGFLPGVSVTGTRSQEVFRGEGVVEGLISEGHTLLQRSAGTLLETLIKAEILILLCRT